MAALEQALRYSSIAGLGPSSPLRPPRSPSLAPLSPSSCLRCDWTRNGQYPTSARPHPRGVPASELGGPRKVVPSRGLVPRAWACSAPDLGKSALGAWSARATVEILFLSETSSSQTYTPQIRTLKPLREGSWLICPGLQGAMVWPGGGGGGRGRQKKKKIVKNPEVIVEPILGAKAWFSICAPYRDCGHPHPQAPTPPFHSRST